MEDAESCDVYDPVNRVTDLDQNINVVIFPGPQSVENEALLPEIRRHTQARVF